MITQLIYSALLPSIMLFLRLVLPELIDSYSATQLSIDGLVVDPIDITKLPLINVEDDPNFPSEVQAFMDQILLADAILFSAPEYNYSVTRNKPQPLISYSFCFF